MNENADFFVYMMANEKMVAMISVIEQNFEFFDEYKVKPDEEVKKVLTPLIDKMRKWIDGK